MYYLQTAFTSDSITVVAMLFHFAAFAPKTRREEQCRPLPRFWARA